MVRCTSHNRIPTTPLWGAMPQCATCTYLRKDSKCWREMYVTTEDVTYDLGDGRTLTIKAGFCFDGASIPRYLWWLVGSPMEGDLQAAALLHDFLYHTHFDGTTKDFADAALYDVLCQCGVSTWRRSTIWKGVHWFGGSSYNVGTDVIRQFEPFGKVTR